MFFTQKLRNFVIEIRLNLLLIFHLSIYITLTALLEAFIRLQGPQNHLQTLFISIPETITVYTYFSWLIFEYFPALLPQHSHHFITIVSLFFYPSYNPLFINVLFLFLFELRMLLFCRNPLYPSFLCIIFPHLFHAKPIWLNHDLVFAFLAISFNSSMLKV